MFVAVDPDGRLLFNIRSQDHFFSSKSELAKAIFEELKEPVAEEIPSGRVITKGESNGWKPRNYRVFQEV